MGEAATVRYLRPHSIPMPELLYTSGESTPVGCPYSVWRFVEGELLQDLMRNA